MTEQTSHNSTNLDT